MIATNCEYFIEKSRRIDKYCCKILHVSQCDWKENGEPCPFRRPIPSDKKKQDIRKNGSGYPDSVASKAITRVDNDPDVRRFQDFLDVIFTIAELSDFHFEERIVVKDKRTGKVWR